jgi:branched-chain amino acid transport system permease protein
MEEPGASHEAIVQLFVVNLLNGLTFGAVLFLLASGLSLIFGVLGVLNLAHGALFMIGAYVGWTVHVQEGLPFWLAIILGALVAGGIGLIIERGFLRRLHQAVNEQALVTFGFVYILTNLTLWIWGPVAKAAYTAPSLNRSITIATFSYPTARLTLIGIGLFLAALMWWLQNRTRIGAIIRAGMDDREMTMGLGVNFERVSIAIFFLGSVLAGGAGVVSAQLLGANLQLSINILLLALVVIVIGGMGSVGGALLGSMVIGLIDTFGKALFPQMAMFSIYLVMIGVLTFRPSGLLGRKAG